MDNDKNDNSVINVSYLALPDVKTIAVSGVAANVTPDGSIGIFFYTERRAFPKSSSISYTDEGVEESDDVFEDPMELVREINQSILIDRSTAAFLSNTLTDILSKLDSSESENPE